MPARGRGLATALACAWLAALASCDGLKAEQSRRDYEDDLVTELCAPGAFYRECWWLSAAECHKTMADWVASSIPGSGKRVQPSRALRRYVLERLIYFHHGFLSQFVYPQFEREGCMDGSRWKHIPPGKEGTMAALYARREKIIQRKRDASSAPATTATPPEPAAEVAPAPSSPEPSGPIPDPASVP